MVVSEIKAAVFDTINVVLPAFIKLILFLSLICYVIYGKITSDLNISFDHVRLEVTDPIYKSAIASIIPVFIITFLLVVSYSVNKFVDTIGELSPLRFSFNSAGILARNTENLKVLWSYMPDAKNIHHLDDKVHRLYIELEARNELYVKADVDWAHSRAGKAKSLLHFTYALFVITVISFYVAKYWFNSPASSERATGIAVFLFLSILILITRYISQERKVYETRFYHVVRYIKTIKGFDFNYEHLNNKLINKMSKAKIYAPVWCKLTTPVGDFPVHVLIDYIKEQVDGN